MIRIPTNTLRALVLHAPKQDVRYYLIGVAIFPQRGHAVATDGHRMLMVKIPTGDGAPFIIPRQTVLDVIKAAGKLDSVDVACSTDSNKPYVTLTLLDGRSWSVPATDGTFPNYQHVIRPGEPTAPAQFDPTYVAAMQESFDILLEVKKGKRADMALVHRGTSAGLCHVDGVDALGLVMPTRCDTSDEHARYLAHAFAGL